jgi:predicted O-methyltransferase YrrM
MIPHYVIDTTAAQTELCQLGHLSRTDKSPFNPAGHRHPYTGVYSMLFAPLRARPALRFAEIGVAMGASIEVWEAYFKRDDTVIYGFDRDEALLADLKQRVPSPRIQCGMMDVQVDGAIHESLATASGGQPYDVIIDDSTHGLEDQLRIIKEAFPLLRPAGGLLIIEDIFRSTPDSAFHDTVLPLLTDVPGSFAYFVDCEHELKWSPGWDNDRLLVIVKG